MTADSLDLPSNVLCAQNFQNCGSGRRRAGERPTVIFCQIILASSSKRKFCIHMSLYFDYWNWEQRKEDSEAEN